MMQINQAINCKAEADVPHALMPVYAGLPLPLRSADEKARKYMLHIYIAV